MHWDIHHPGQSITKEVIATKDMVKSGSLRASEVEAAHEPTAAKLKKNNGICARSGRHAIYFSFRSRRSAGVKEYDHNNSWYS